MHSSATFNDNLYALCPSDYALGYVKQLYSAFNRPLRGTQQGGNSIHSRRPHPQPHPQLLWWGWFYIWSPTCSFVSPILAISHLSHLTGTMSARVVPKLWKPSGNMLENCSTRYCGHMSSCRYMRTLLLYMAHMVVVRLAAPQVLKLQFQFNLLDQLIEMAKKLLPVSIMYSQFSPHILWHWHCAYSQDCIKLPSLNKSHLDKHHLFAWPVYTILYYYKEK